jgi:hypothetical protein
VYKDPTVKGLAFRKLEGVQGLHGVAHHDVYKDPTVKGLAFRIHELAEKLKNLPVVKRAARRHFFFNDGSSDGVTAATATMAVTTAATAATATTTAGLQLIDRLLYQLVPIMSLCAFVSSSSSWT